MNGAAALASPFRVPHYPHYPVTEAGCKHESFYDSLYSMYGCLAVARPGTIATAHAIGCGSRRWTSVGLATDHRLRVVPSSTVEGMRNDRFQLRRWFEEMGEQGIPIK